jgi:hypothetical protein|tara:strand:+ start:30510 stop:31226 length:717 start_codon:yes stop_codon:yes gene_type:complete
MKNIAILITGLTRTYKETFNSFKTNVIESNADCDIDIYLSFWDKTHDRTFKAGSVYDSYDPIDSIKTSKDNVIETYNPKNYVELNFDKYYKLLKTQSENPNLKDLNFVRNKNFTLNSFFCQFYCWKRGIEIISTDINYDLVLKIRFDSIFNTPIIFSDFTPSVFSSGGWNNTFINDFVFCSNYQNMSFLMREFYDSLLRDDIVEFKDEFLPEKYITYTIKKHGIEINNKTMTTHIKKL